MRILDIDLVQNRDDLMHVKQDQRYVFNNSKVKEVYDTERTRIRKGYYQPNAI